MYFILGLHFLIFQFNTSVAQSVQYPWAVCRGTTIVNTAYIPPNANHKVQGKTTRSTLFNFDYSSNVTPSEKSAIEHAGMILGDCFATTIPIFVSITKSTLPTGQLARARPYDALKNFNASQANPKYELDVYYPYALADFLKGNDLDGSNYDIELDFSDLLLSSYTWYTGKDGNASNMQYDLVTVILHEILHGMGVITTLKVDNSGTTPTYIHGFIDNSIYYPNRFDKFIKSTLIPNTALSNFAYPGSTTLDLHMASPCIFDGPQAILANTNNPVYLEDNDIANGYVGVKELKEISFPNECLGSQTDVGLGKHDIGAVSVGILNDIGWNVHCPPLSSMDYFTMFNGLNTQTNPPEIDLSTNVQYKYKALFVDVAPTDFIGTKTWKLNLFHKTGVYDVPASNILGDIATYMIPTNLPSGYEWKRNKDGKILGEIVVSAMVSNTHLLVKTLDITLKYKHDEPIILMTTSSNNNFNCDNINIDYFARGSSQYHLHYRETIGFNSWITVLFNSPITKYYTSGLNEAISYDFEVIASNPWGNSSKKVTRTRCTFPVIVSPIPSNTIVDVKTLYTTDLIKQYTITDIITGGIHLEDFIEIPTNKLQIDISGLPVGTYYISFKSDKNEVGGCKIIRSE